ncbi:MAG TPA: IS256 family transposase [Gemmatimonadaceae bacterium]
MALSRKSMSVPLMEQPRTPAPAPDDLLRQMLTTIVQQTLEEEFTRFLGAAPHERTHARRGWRNGHRARRFTTRVGSLELRVPRDRAGLFQPALFARYERSEQAFVAALVEMYVQGISTRKVTHVVETLCGVQVSASAVSAVVKKLDAEIAVWRTRDLGGEDYPYLVLDAHVEQVRREGQVRSTAMLWAIGIRADGYREHLGTWLGASESLESWTMVCEDLVRRGLHGVRYAVSDEHQGLVIALRRFFPEAAHQRCQVHYLRNALSRVSARGAQEQLLAALRDVWAAPTRAEAEGRLTRLVGAVRKRVPPLATWLEETAPATLEFFALATPVQRRLASTNSVELDHAEFRRRTRVIRIFPNEASLLRLGTALAIERNEVWSVRRYFDPKETILAVTHGRIRLRRSA